MNKHELEVAFAALQTKLDLIITKIDSIDVKSQQIKDKVDTLENVPVEEIKTSLSDLMGAVLNN